MARGVIWIGFFVLTVISVGAQTLSVSSYLTQQDKTRLKSVFDSALPFPDLATAHYAVFGYKLLTESVPNPQEVCKYAQTKVDAKNVESIFYASGISKALGNCPMSNGGFQGTLENAIVEGISSQNLYFVVTAMKNLNIKYDSNKISRVLTAARKKDDGALSLGYALHVASLLTTDVSTFVDWVEDTVVQADEVDGRLLQFEGGLSVSAIVVSGIYRLGEVSKKPLPAIDGEKAIKFANYFLSRKQVQVVRPAYHLLDILHILSNNKINIPVSVTLASPLSVPVTKPTATLHISNILGGHLGQLTVTLVSVMNKKDKTSVSVNKALTPEKDDKLSYNIELSSHNLKRGLYLLNVNLKPSTADSRLVGIGSAQVTLKLTTEIAVPTIEVGVSDVDQSTAPRLTQVQFPNKLQNILEADYHQKLQMKFVVSDKIAKESITVHQAFVVLSHKKTSQEIIFVAEADSSNVYKFDLDVQSKIKDFGSLSGAYSLIVIVGDALVWNSIRWHLADIEITFQESAPLSLHVGVSNYEPKQEIKHVFREPEKRPPLIVSNAFTVLVFVPLVLLFVLWAKIGANVSNLNFNLGTIGFYLGLSGIFLLFMTFWLHLTMFETLKYLALLGVVTFLCGNQMLKKIAASHK